MTKPPPKVLVINPGSTSTRTALYRGRRMLLDAELKHPSRSLDRLGGVIAQADLRRRAVVAALRRHGTKVDEIDAFIGRGGLLRPVAGGVYRVNERMLADLRACRYGEHASNLGGILAAELAAEHGKPAYIADPVVVDELSAQARLSGHPDLPRRSVFHALSHKAVARKAAARLGRPYERCNLVVVHAGGGVSVAAHRRGRVVDVNNALDGEGPFSPDRTGGLALLDFYRYATDRGFSVADAARFITRGGGLRAHLGTNDCRAIEAKAARGDRRYMLVYEAFIYQVAKAVGAMAAALSGKVDAIVVTGGVARGGRFRRRLKGMVGFLAPVYAILGQTEMEALAAAAAEVHAGRRRAKVY